MGFLTCSIKSEPSSGVTVEEMKSICLSGRNGIFAAHLPSLADDEGAWSLSAEELLGLADPEGHANGIVFDQASDPASRQMLYRLVAVNGRTVSLITDVLFQFKLLKRESGVLAGESGDQKGTSWVEGPERYEQLRLEGGKVGGDWRWGDSPNAVCATLL